VITFLDDCVQRCIKTPYRYIEELQGFIKDTTIRTPNDHLPCYPSPLLMTVIEQLNAKVGAKLLSPSDTLSLASFMRKVVVNLFMKVSNLSLLQSLSTKIDAILSEERLFSEYPALTTAVRREITILKSCLSRLVRDSELVHDSVSISREVADFLREVARLSPRKLRCCLRQMADVDDIFSCISNFTS
jgi:nucleolar pre-ribosomal-associated protein 1